MENVKNSIMAGYFKRIKAVVETEALDTWDQNRDVKKLVESCTMTMEILSNDQPEDSLIIVDDEEEF